jgi:hypothetical protein
MWISCLFDVVSVELYHAKDGAVRVRGRDRRTTCSCDGGWGVGGDRVARVNMEDGKSVKQGDGRIIGAALAN